MQNHIDEQQKGASSAIILIGPRCTVCREKAAVYALSRTIPGEGGAWGGRGGG
jgi:hypothetical protein